MLAVPSVTRVFPLGDRAKCKRRILINDDFVLYANAGRASIRWPFDNCHRAYHARLVPRNRYTQQPPLASGSLARVTRKSMLDRARTARSLARSLSRYTPRL